MRDDRYSAAIRYLALMRENATEEEIALVSYVWHKDGPAVLADIDRARRGKEVQV